MGWLTAFGAALMIGVFGYLIWGTPPVTPTQYGQQAYQHSAGPYADWAARQVGELTGSINIEGR